MTGSEPASQFKPRSGSFRMSEPDFLVIGKLRRPHGVRGEIIMDVITDFPERIKTGSTVFVGEDYQPIKLKTIREHQKGLLVSFDNYSTPEKVGIFRNWMVYVKASDLPLLPEGEYYHHQVIGLQVIDERGNALGTVTDIVATGANDVLVVLQESGIEFLLPVVDEMVLKIDIEKGVIYARPLSGLIPEVKKSDKRESGKIQKRKISHQGYE